MRIRSLDLVRYGHFTDATLQFPSGGPDFHIVYGENETGKSTTKSAIEELLFGISGQPPRNFMHENNALRIGAKLESAGTSIDIRRRKGNKDTLLGLDDLPLASGDGLLGSLLGGIDRSFYCRMFCLDHERLRVGGRDIIQAKDDIGATLFAAGAGVSGLRERLAAMDEEAGNLWASRKAGHRKYYQAEDRLKEADVALRTHTVTATKWQEMKSTYEEARDACVQIEKQIEEHVTELAKIARVRRIYRSIRRLGENRTESDSLGIVVELPADAGSRFETASADNASAEARINAFQEQMAAVKTERDAATVDESVLIHETEIDRLSKRSIELAPERAALPRRRSDLAAAEDALRRAAAELDWHGDVAELLEMIPPRGKVAVLRGLLTSRGECFATVDSAHRTSVGAGEKLADVQDRIGVMGSPQDLSGLAGLVKSVRALGDLDARLFGAQNAHREAEELCQRRMALMRLPAFDEATLVAQKLPSSATVMAHRDAARDLSSRMQSQQAGLRDLTREIANNRKSYERLVSDEKIISAEDLLKLRERRNAGWSIIRRRHIEHAVLAEGEEEGFAESDTLIDAYESAVDLADVAADRRFQNAAATAEAMVLARQIADQQDRLVSQQAECSLVADEQTALTATWTEMWLGVTESPLLPDEMLEWLEERSDLLDQIAKRDDTARGASSLQRELVGAKQQLLTLLQDKVLIASAEAMPLNGILAAAEMRIREEAANASKREELALEERKAKADVENKRRAVEDAEKKRDAWTIQWRDALRELNLSPEAEVQAVEEQIEAIDAMRETALKIVDLRQERIGKIERDIEAFSADVQKLVTSTSPDLAGADADEAILRLHTQLSGAKQAMASRKEKDNAVRGLQEKLDECNRSRKDATAAIESLQRAADVESIDALRTAIRLSDRQRALTHEQEQLRATLEADGDGLALEALVEECRNNDLDQATAREQTLTQSLKETRERQLTAAERRNDAQRTFDAVGGDAAAARAASDRQVALTEMKDAASQYARVRSAALILRWAIERFRREKQAPLLKRAGELFSILTCDSFVGLTLQYDEKDIPHLAGVRGDGKVVLVSGLSEGAADQLFMALRIAAVEEFLSHEVAVPFIADDLFINYDDARAAAGFRVLRQLSERTQVIFFTHHQHLVSVAQGALGGQVSTVVLEALTTPMKNVA
jgi:uncharacterized protein YhaN